MSSQYKLGIVVGIGFGILIYFIAIWLLPVLGKLTWLYT
jgi:phage shock protein PspC (stress-responsive transcriptional regulator)